MGAMPLHGTFDVLDFSSVMELLADRRMSGRLHLRGRSYTANLFFVDGVIVGADQSEHQAAGVAGDAAQRIQETCFELLGTDRGNFEFHPGRASAPVGGTNISVGGSPRAGSPALGRMAGAPGPYPLARGAAASGLRARPGQVTLDREQWRVLTAVDGRRNLRSIGRALNLSDFEVCRAMRQLFNAKVIELDMRPVGMSGISEIEAPLVTEQVTINGKRATRVRTNPVPPGRTRRARRTATPPAPTIVISPTKQRPEIRPAPPLADRREATGTN